jgi:hypothetical protein
VQAAEHAFPAYSRRKKQDAFSTKIRMPEKTHLLRLPGSWFHYLLSYADISAPESLAG